MVQPMRLLSVASFAAPTLAKTSDSQVMLQVANLKRAGALQNLHNGVHAMETRMESMLSEAIASGEAPKKLDNEAYKMMEDALSDIESQLKNTEKTANEDAWTAANLAVTQCGTTMKEMMFERDDVGAKPLKEDYENTKVLHETCREEENNLNGDEKQKHTGMKSKATAAKGAKPNNMCNLEAIAPSDVAAEALSKAEAVLAALKDAGTWAANHKEGLATAIGDYDAAKELSDAKETDCDTAQHEFEMDFCEYDVSVNTICTVRDNCVAKHKQLREATKTALTDKIIAEKLILQSCSKVRCYLKLIKGEVDGAGDLKRKGADAAGNPAYTITKEDYAECQKEGTYNTDAGTWNPDGPADLDITYDEDSAEVCDKTGIKLEPDGLADGDWYNTHYKTLGEGLSDWMGERQGLAPSKVCFTHLKPAAQFVLIADNSQGENGCRKEQTTLFKGMVADYDACKQKCIEVHCQFMQHHVSQYCSVYAECPLTRKPSDYQSQAKVYRVDYPEDPQEE